MIVSRENSKISMFFQNGYSISIIFGWGSYTDNRNHPKMNDLSKEYEVTSSTVEIAIFDSNNNWYNFETEKFEKDSTDVAGYISIDDLAEWIYKVKSF